MDPVPSSVPWNDFVKGDVTLNGMGIWHVCEAIRHVHSASRKKLPHPVLVQFLPDDPDMLPMETFKKQVGLLLSFWGVSSADAILNLESILTNCILDSSWSEAEWGKEKSNLPGMDGCAFGKEFEEHCRSQSVDVEGIVASWEKDASRMRRRRRVGGREDDAESAIRCLEEKAAKLEGWVDLVKRREEGTPWLIRVLEEAFSVDTERKEEDATTWLMTLDACRGDASDKSVRKERKAQEEGSKAGTLSSLSASALIRSLVKEERRKGVTPTPKPSDMSLDVPSLSREDMTSLLWLNTEPDDGCVSPEEELEEYASLFLCRLSSKATDDERRREVEVILSNPHVSAPDMALSSLFHTPFSFPEGDRSLVEDLLFLGALDPNSSPSRLPLLEWATIMKRPLEEEALLRAGATRQDGRTELFCVEQ